MRIGLVGCVKSKWIHPAPAQDLYVSTLFKGRRSFVEQTCDRWFILSAKHGLVEPLQLIEPYDVALTQESTSYKIHWSRSVIRQIQEAIGNLSGIIFEIHSGAAYRDFGLVEGLLELGATVEIPTGDLRFGELLSFYSVRDSVSKEHSKPPSLESNFIHKRTRTRKGYEAIGEYLSELESDSIILTFEEIEEIIGAELPPSASKYGVWWANSETNPQSKGWVPFGWKVYRIKVAERVVRFLKQETFETSRRQTIPGATAKQMGFIKMAESIVEHEIPPLRVNIFSFNPDDIVKAMLEYGSKLELKNQREGISYTPNVPANEFILGDPFAFLVGVIFDQGIPAERAWAAPYELKKRLGHLNPSRLAVDFPEIATAIQRQPSLHRFVNNMSEWIGLAAQQVIREYNGDASNIWNDNPSAIELMARLTRFKGIGQKKAAMTVELLARDFGVNIRDLHSGEVAFDVHIRRVFLRTGLSEFDALDEIVKSARENHPERPGSLDGPAWNIGRNWCRPSYPACPACVLDDVCPKYIDRADGVKGV